VVSPRPPSEELVNRQTATRGRQAARSQATPPAARFSSGTLWAGRSKGARHSTPRYRRTRPGHFTARTTVASPGSNKRACPVGRPSPAHPGACWGHGIAYEVLRGGPHDFTWGVFSRSASRPIRPAGGWDAPQGSSDAGRGEPGRPPAGPGDIKMRLTSQWKGSNENYRPGSAPGFFDSFATQVIDRSASFAG